MFSYGSAPTYCTWSRILHFVWVAPTMSSSDSMIPGMNTASGSKDRLLGKRLLGSGSINKQYTLLGVSQDTKNEETRASFQSVLNSSFMVMY